MILACNIQYLTIRTGFHLDIFHTRVKSIAGRYFFQRFLALSSAISDQESVLLLLSSIYLQLYEGGGGECWQNWKI